MILTNTSGHLILADRVRMKTISTSRLVIYEVQPSHSGKYECLASTDLGNATATFNYTVIPDPPSGFSVDKNQTTSSTFVIAWQPGFDGGLQQTFTLEYCPNGTQVEKEGCGVVKDLTETSYTLKGLEPLTSYRMTLWAVNSAGNSSAVETVASTTGRWNSLSTPGGRGNSAFAESRPPEPANKSLPLVIFHVISGL
eukprot:XP_011668687.1 PREDICTED: nephrin-like [Strongylocentrotus purpuratus]